MTAGTAIALGLLLSAASVQAAICSLCPGAGNCTLSTTYYIQNGCVLNLGDDDVTVTATGKLTTEATGHSYTVLARSMRVQGTLEARGGTLVVWTTGTAPSGYIRTEALSSPGRIDVRDGGTAFLIAATSVTLGGQEINADGGGASPRGGTIKAYGTPIATSASLHATGNGGDGGQIALISGGDLSVAGTVNVDGVGAPNGQIPGDGGTIVLKAGGSMTVSQTLFAKGGLGGQGGAIELSAAGLATLYNNYSVVGDGGAGYADGGTITADAGSLTIGGAWNASGNTGAAGGVISVTARTGAIQMLGSSSMNASGGNSAAGVGGTVAIDGPGTVTIDGSITANAGGADSAGGSIDIDAGGALTVSSSLEARSSATSGWRNGHIEIAGCTVHLTGSLKTLNSAGEGTNVVEYVQGFTGSGASVLADDPDGNLVYCNCIDANADGVCDQTPMCAQNPAVGGTFNPPQVLTPRKLTCS